MKSVTFGVHTFTPNCHKVGRFLYQRDTEFHNLVQAHHRSNTQRRKGSGEKEQVYLWRTHFPQVNTKPV